MPATAAPPDFMRWKAALRKAGFQAGGTGGRKGAYLSRTVGPRKQSVGVMEHRHEPDRYNVQLNINAPLPHAETPFDVVILIGDLGRDGIVTGHLHYATWWGEEESVRAWQMMEDHGLPWLERYGSPENLIEFYETALREGLPPAPGFASATPVEAPKDYRLWLAMLYEEIGRREEACRHAMALYERTKAHCTRKELQRMERHLRALGCES